MAPFCSCPASLVSRKFFAVGPGCAKCFSFFALRWAPRPFGGARAKKKKHHPGCFFLLRPRGKAREGEAPLEAGTGPEQKKKHHPGCFFLLRPRGKAREGEAPLEAGTGLFFFCSGPVPASNGASPSPAFPRGRSKKKHPGWCFFLCSGPVPASNGASPSLAFRRGRSKTKNTLGGVFSFAAAPRGRSLTHCGPGWRCLPLAGAVFYFLLPAPPGPGWCFFFFCCGPARTLTHSRWAGAISGKARVVFFFLLRPRRVFETIAKNVWGTTSGLKRPGGATAKKKTPLP